MKSKSKLNQVAEHAEAQAKKPRPAPSADPKASEEAPSMAAHGLCPDCQSAVMKHFGKK